MVECWMDIRYKYAGHRMAGFQIYARADDVIADGWPGNRLPTTRHLTQLSCSCEQSTTCPTDRWRNAGAFDGDPATAGVWSIFSSQ